jgi:hypothetical protein
VVVGIVEVVGMLAGCLVVDGQGIGGDYSGVLLLLLVVVISI